MKSVIAVCALALIACPVPGRAFAQGWHHPGYDLETTRFNPDASVALPDPAAPFDLAWSQPVTSPYAAQFWILTGDINGDGELEVVTFPYLGDTVSAFSADGSLLWQAGVAGDAGIGGLGINGGELADVDNDGSVEVLTGCSAGSDWMNGAARVLVYAADGTLDRSPIVMPNCWRVDHVRAVDVDKNGSTELVVSLLSGYPLSPRGIYLYDYATGTQVWSFATGPIPADIAIGDVDGDSYPDIVTGFFAPHNGHWANGLSDSYSYVLALDRAGGEIWRRQIGTESTNPGIADMTGDGSNEVVVTKLQYMYGGTNEILILAGPNGQILHSYAGTSRWDWTSLADLNGDGNTEIAVGDWSQAVRILDCNAQLLNSTAGASYVYAANDINGDGGPELLAGTSAGLRVYDRDLNLLWSHAVSPQGPAIVASDLDGDGVNEILVAADQLYCLKATAPIEVLTVAVDIKPGTCPNPFNLASSGVLPVAILGAEDFDVAAVDPATILLEGVAPLRVDVEDVGTAVGPEPEPCECPAPGPDGYPDLSLKFDSPAIAAALGSVQDRETRTLTLTGMTYEGSPIRGQDCVIVFCKGRSTTTEPPFRPMASSGAAVTFSLADRCQVSLKVYDVQGREVRTLVDGCLDRGTHTVSWDGADGGGRPAAIGVYFCRLNTQAGRETARLIIAR